MPDTAARVETILRDCAVQVMRTDCDYVRLSGRLFHAADALDAAAGPLVRESSLPSTMFAHDHADAAAAETCEWTDDNGLWETACGEAWLFSNDGGPVENGMKYCHACGKPVTVKEG